ncbi:hypothetical protein [Sphaerisporangium perillae]|uniref:hypothetical protein n=1 Tax=Sphaerisporangium perillae TaxID=2935860 RepID=UPI00200ECEAD|nr:hypothetical protein [Sphaerisporangium perillae]
MSESIRTPSVWSLPWHTLRLAGRCLLPLVMWYSAGQLVRFGLMVGGTELSHGSMRDLRLALTMLVFIIMVMASLIVTVGMFHSVRGALWEMRARRADGEEDEGFVGAISRVILPFAVLYLSWGWHVDDVREFLNTDIKRQSGEQGYLGAWGGLDGSSGAGTAEGLTSLNFNLTLAIMIAAFVGRYIFTVWYERRGARQAAFAVAFCELSFFYYGAQVIVSRGSWVSSREAYTWWDTLVEGLRSSIPGWDAFWGLVGAIKPYAADALLLPAIWLTVAILVYGAYAEDTTTVIKGTRLETTAAQAGQALNERTHSLTRQTLTRFFGRWGHWVPLVHTVRLTVRAGAPLFGLFVLCFAAIQVGEGYARRGLEYLAGTDHPILYWDVIFVPINFVVDFGLTVLTTCLLAATFDVAAGAERRRRAQAVSDRTEVTARIGSFPGSHPATAPARPGLPVPSGPRSAG